MHADLGTATVHRPLSCGSRRAHFEFDAIQERREVEAFATLGDTLGGQIPTGAGGHGVLGLHPRLSQRVRARAEQRRRAHTRARRPFLQHVAIGALRCLALSSRGGVYEGDLTVLEGGALRLDLKGYEGDRVVPHVVRFGFETDGTLRNRVWFLEGSERTLMLDMHHERLAPRNE